MHDASPLRTTAGPCRLPAPHRPHRPSTGPAPVHGTVLVLTASVGAGHDGAGRELARRLTARGARVEVRDYVEALPRASRWTVKDLYGPVVQHAPFLFEGVFRRLEHDGLVRRASDAVCRQAEDRVATWAEGADCVVSTYPLAGQTVGDLRRQGRLAVPTLTYLTDPAAHATWMHADVDHHLTVTTATALDAARYGVRATACGPLSAPTSGADRSRARVRLELGLPGSAPVVLLSAGSLGMGDVRRTVDDLLLDPHVHLVVLCGRNERLRRRLSRWQRVVALRWRDDVSALMGAADALVHNAGGLCLTEAMAAGLPAITYRPIPGHGRANAQVLEDAGIAPWPRDEMALGAAVRRVESTSGPRVPAAGEHWPAGADPADVVAQVLADRRPEALALVRR
ncbi:MGDG synthase family glycosyltransferase [uncultured Pseudokineococcus sp.]|uniref:MGDG synthase family glycosyltransferase n=1 Tax=uncultured Pseudokineococcus sp. TaxID=1642928 RepID=UPI0026346C0B|nr:glycosyltransferase [uncultured Pseudokineococcus sp.]